MSTEKNPNSKQAIERIMVLGGINQPIITESVSSDDEFDITFDDDEFDTALKEKLTNIALRVRNHIEDTEDGFENTCDIAAEMVEAELALPHGFEVVNGEYDDNGHVYVMVFDEDFNVAIVDPTITQFRDTDEYVITDPDEIGKYHD